MAELLKGGAVATALTNKLIERVQFLQVKNVKPCLAIVRVGEKSDDITYENAAIKRCGKIGIEVKQYILPADCTKEQLLAVINEINGNKEIDGCLLFRPLANKEMEEAACQLLDPKKDVDSMTQGSLAKVFSGKGEGYYPCTAQACIEMLDYYNIDLTGKRVAVIGRSLVIGKPVSILLQNKNATVTMCHSKTKDMAKICQESDVIVVAIGKANFLTSEFVNENSVVIDVGINVNEEGKLCGDADFANINETIKAISPVPGGVGSITTAVLAQHVVEACEKRN